MTFKYLLKKPHDKGTEKEMERDPRWNGVPPLGNNPITNKYKFLGMVFLVFLVKIVIWSGYRWMTGNIYPLTVREVSYTVSIFAKPILQLGPVFLLWWYLFKERGMPFKFTKTNLFTSVVWGCIGALVFFLVASLVFVGHLLVTGQGSDFHVVAGWDDVGWVLVIATMFSYMVSTGPAEELFSRGFLQDQTARAFSIGGAILFSSILFAIGHLPISIMVHRMETAPLLWYMATLVVMGAFFSIIYHWSRNIVLGILIHGLWDWYLTLFKVKGAYSASIISDPAAAFGYLDFVNTMITLIIVLPLFYMLYKNFWKREAGEKRAGDRKKMKAISRWAQRIRARDRGDGIKHPLLLVFGITLAFCLLMYPAAALVSTNEPELMVDRRMVPLTETKSMEMSISEKGGLDEGRSYTYTVTAEKGNIHNINVTLTWDDEPDESGPYRSYENQPDTFKCDVMGPGGEKLVAEENSAGTLRASWINDGEALLYNTLEVTVTLLEAGDQTHPNPLIGDKPDNSNDYSIQIEYSEVWEQTEAESDADIRW